MLNYGSSKDDFTTAAKALAEIGYGTQRQQAPSAWIGARRPRKGKALAAIAQAMTQVQGRP